MFAPVSKVEKFKAVLRCDPALNLKKSKYDKYLETLNEEHLVFKEGQKPTYFLIGVPGYKNRLKVYSIMMKYEEFRNPKKRIKPKDIPPDMMDDVGFMVQACLYGWENFPYPFEERDEGGASDASMEMLLKYGIMPLQCVSDVAIRIFVLQEQDTKN